VPAFLYWAYGLCLACDEPLKGLFPAPPDVTPDLWTELRDDDDHGPGDLPNPRAWRIVRLEPPLTAWVASSSAGPAFRLRYGTAVRNVEFTISRSGSRIRARRTGECTIGDVEALLLGPVLAAALRARGAICLHASAVAIDGLAVALLGEGGAGKSTTAAGLLRLGARPLADDLTVVVEREGRFLVHGGSRRLRLHPDAAAALGVENDLPRVWPDLPDRPERRYLDPPDESVDLSFPAPVPLVALYILPERDSKIEGTVIEPLSAAHGLAALLSDASPSFMLPELGLPPEFDRRARLARAVPIRTLRRGVGLERLDSICRAIRDDAMELARRPDPVLA
jgi:hypothetical protein